MAARSSSGMTWGVLWISGGNFAKSGLKGISTKPSGRGNGGGACVREIWLVCPLPEGVPVGLGKAVAIPEGLGNEGLLTETAADCATAAVVLAGRKAGVVAAR